MSAKKDRVQDLCSAAIKRVDEAIANHQRGQPEDLSVPMLINIRAELVNMQESLAPATFRPSFGRFILDWPDQHGLIQQLSNVAYEYGRLK